MDTNLPQKINLYSLVEQHKAIVNAIIDNDAEVDDETFALYNETKEAGIVKMQSIFYIRDVINSEISLQDEYEKKAKDAKKKLNTAIDRLEGYLEKGLIAFCDNPNKPELVISTDKGQRKLSFRPSESVEITDESLLNDEYVTKKVVITPDKNKIKKDLKEGFKVEGAEFNHNQNLQIK